METALALLALLSATFDTFPTPLEAAIEHVESRGDTFAQAGSHRGLWQVKAQFASPVVREIPALLHVPLVGRVEGRRMLAYWQRRCKGDMACALRGYRCGNKGLHGKCGHKYASAILRYAKSGL